jgi:hypothetical protein
MKQAIGTAPRDGEFVLLVEEASFEVAQWSADNWVGENGASIKMRPTHWMPLLQNNVVARPADRENRARLGSRSFIFLGLLGGVAVALPILNAGAPFLSPKPPDARSVQLPAASAQTTAPKAVIAERQVPPAATASQAKSVTKGLEALQEQALVREPERADALARDLATARWESEARSPLATTDAQTTEAAATQRQLEQELKEERERAIALTRDLAAARREIEARSAPPTTDAQTAEAAATRQQQEQELKEERERAAALTRDLVAARREIDAHNTWAAALTRDLAAARREIREIQVRTGVAATTAIQAHTGVAETTASDSAAAAPAVEAAAIRQRQALEEERERQAGEAVALRQAAEGERQGADVLAGELAAPRQPIEATTGSANGMDIAHVETKATPTHAANKDIGLLDRPVSPEAQVSVEAKKLLTRADLFLRQGDISAARVVLERAIDMGSTEAGYRLAETYDPVVLSSWRTLGTRGDPAKARDLYARAYADGIQQAKDRMNALH